MRNHRGISYLISASIIVFFIISCSPGEYTEFAGEYETLKSDFQAKLKQSPREEREDLKRNYISSLNLLIEKTEGKTLPESQQILLAGALAESGSFDKSEALYEGLIESADPVIKQESFTAAVENYLQQKKFNEAGLLLGRIKDEYSSDLTPFIGLFLQSGVRQRNSDLKTALTHLDVALSRTVPADSLNLLYTAIHIKFVDGGLDNTRRAAFLQKMKEGYGSNTRIAGQIERKEKFLAFIGADAPEISGSGEWINSPSFSIKKARGKYVLIDFSAPWCPDCRRSLPAFLELAEKLKGKLETVWITRLYGYYADEDTPYKMGITPEEETGLNKAYIERKGINMPAFIATDTEVSDSFRTSSIPHYVLIGPDGKVFDLCMERIHDFFKKVEETVTSN